MFVVLLFGVMGFSSHVLGTLAVVLFILGVHWAGRRPRSGRRASPLLPAVAEPWGISQATAVVLAAGGG